MVPYFWLSETCCYFPSDTESVDPGASGLGEDGKEDPFRELWLSLDVQPISGQPSASAETNGASGWKTWR